MKKTEELLEVSGIGSDVKEPKKLPTVKINGVLYEVHNKKAEDIATAESLIISKVEDNGSYQSYYKTPYGIVKDNERALKRSGLGTYLERHTIENYQTPHKWQEKIKSSATSYINEPQGWFVMMGQSGSGKTMICNAIAIELMRKGRTLKYMLWFDEINKIKYNMDQNARFVDSLIKPSILYIDDFLKTRGRTEPTDIELELAFQILDARYRFQKTTIISSEKLISEIRGYDQAVYGRIIEMAGSNLFVIEPDDSKNWRETSRLKK